MTRAKKILSEKPTHVAAWGVSLSALAFSLFAFPAIAAKADAARVSAAAVVDAPLDSTRLMTSVTGLTDTLAEEFLDDSTSARAVGAAIIDKASHQAREHKCLSEAIFYEARSEGKDGQKAVAEVIQNRVRSKHYPNSICGVVYQGSKRKTGCQFSFTCDGSLDRTPKGKTWLRANHIATLAMTGGITPITDGATHYHNLDVKPAWSDSLVMTKQIETHKFYRTRWRERPATSASISVAPPSP